jgi:hypothetical protein
MGAIMTKRTKPCEHFWDVAPTCKQWSVNYGPVRYTLRCKRCGQKYNPNWEDEPRDAHGRWVAAGGEGDRAMAEAIRAAVEERLNNERTENGREINRLYDVIYNNLLTLVNHLGSQDDMRRAVGGRRSPGNEQRAQEWKQYWRNVVQWAIRQTTNPGGADPNSSTAGAFADAVAADVNDRRVSFPPDRPLAEGGVPRPAWMPDPSARAEGRREWGRLVAACYALKIRLIARDGHLNSEAGANGAITNARLESLTVPRPDERGVFGR